MKNQNNTKLETKPNDITYVSSLLQLNKNYIANLANILYIGVNDDMNKDKYPYEITWVGGTKTNISEDIFQCITKTYIINSKQ